ncbi:MAG: hypothetical protein NTW21_16790 [Verrucomicrobia bacterium]|nr:hypothetical protein [Verrucomicrobiota bacterium]
MRVLPLVLCLAVFSAKLGAEPLSSADREALLETLEKLRGTVTERVDARFRKAILAYRSAMTSEAEALEFYLKCVEKVRFEKQFKKPSEFRDWKKREEDNLSQTSMRRALIHQLRWLVLTLHAASEDADRGKLAVEAQQIIDDLFADAAALSSQQQILGQNVTSTVFARAYEIGEVELEKWPFSPLNLGEVYELVLLPQYRASGDLAILRAGWMKRITQESVLHEPMPAKIKGNGRPLAAESSSSPDRKRFLTETVPELQWRMEMDLFRCGDQRGAAVRMLAHIEKHLTHARVREWSDELKNLLSPKPIVTPSPSETTEATPEVSP